MTYLEIQNEVKENVIDLPTVVSNRVPTLVNRALQQIQTKYNFKVMESEQAYVTTLETRSIGAVPTDFKEWRLDPFFLENLGNWKKLVLAPNIQATRIGIAEDDIGYPQFILESDATTVLNASALSVYPLPDGNSDWDDGEYRIKVPYVKYLPALTANGDTNWFTVNAEEYLINQATAYGFLADWDEDRMAVWAQLAENKFLEVRTRDKHYRLSGVDTLVPHLDANEPRIRL